VTFDKRAHNPYLVASGLADHPTPHALVRRTSASGFAIPDPRRWLLLSELGVAWKIEARTL